MLFPPDADEDEKDTETPNEEITPDLEQTD